MKAHKGAATKGLRGGTGLKDTSETGLELEVQARIEP